MKALFLIGLLLNVMMLAWEWHSGAFNATVTQSPLDDERQILLVSEHHSDPQVPVYAVVEDIAPEITVSEDLNPDKSLLEEPVLITTDQATVNPIATEQEEHIETSSASALNHEVVQQTSATVTELEPADTDLIPVKAISCFVIGPFNDRAAIDIWVGESYPDRVVAEQTHEVIHRYLVYLDTHEQTESPVDIVQDLEDKGVKDYWLFREGELKDLISLGLFQSEARANLLQKRLRQRGVETRIMPRYKQEVQYFIRVQTESTPQTEENLQAIRCPSLF